MKAKKISKGIATVVIGSLLLGCQSSNEPPVVVRKPIVLAEEARKTEAGITIEEQVQAPKEYKNVISSDNGILKVTIDAKVIIPEAEGFKLKRVVGRSFTQEDIDKQVKVLLKENVLTRNKYIEGDGISGYTKAEVKKMLEEWEQKQAQGIEIEPYMTGELEEEYKYLSKLYEEAPETLETEIVEPQIKDWSSQQTTDENVEYGFDGAVQIDGVEYQYNVVDFWKTDMQHAYVTLSRNGLCSDTYPLNQNDSVRKELPFTSNIEELKKHADETVAALGLTDMKMTGGEDYATDIPNESFIGNGEAARGYGFHYTRLVDGIPITYTEQDGEVWIQAEQQTESDEIEIAGENEMYVDESTTEVMWEYEQFYLVYDDKGLLQFKWMNPYEITDLSEEHVFLLPFSDIQSIFEQMIVTKNRHLTEEYYEMAEINIHEVRLGYARVVEKGKTREGTLIPVWDFFGTEKEKFKESDNVVWEGNERYKSYLTINAMDGTIIDRGY